MKKLRANQLNVCLQVIAVLFMCIWSIPAQGQSVTWQILPFPANNWPGPQGHPAITNGNLVTLNGGPVRTVETFSGPLTISYDVVLPARTMPDGAIQLFFLPPGVASNQWTPNLKLDMEYKNYGSDDLNIQANNDSTRLWGEVPFSVNPQTVYHFVVEVTGAGELTWIINDLTNVIPNTVTVPFSEFQLELLGWQPENVWYVSNFTVVPEPSTVALVGVSLGSMLLFIRRRKSR